ncbi:hypothetical protein Hanom_Chr07g00666221 [Helianthus anomalus]
MHASASNTQVHAQCANVQVIQRRLQLRSYATDSWKPVKQFNDMDPLTALYIYFFFLFLYTCDTFFRYYVTRCVTMRIV